MTLTEILLTVDGVGYPVDFAKVSGEQVIVLRSELGVSPIDLVRSIYAGEAELLEVVALMGLSLQQRDEPADFRWLARHVSLDSDIEVETGDETDADGSDLLAAFLAPDPS